MYTDLSAAAVGADLIVSHLAACATPLVAEKSRTPWVSVVLQPAVLFSAYDPPSLPIFGDSVRLSRAVARFVFGLIRSTTNGWMNELYELRRELDLPTSRKHPLFEGQFSPFGTLAFFSRAFAQPQPDWPSNLTITGFPFYDKLSAGSSGLSPEIRRFLAAGPPPVVFTLGTSAVVVPGDFYATSAAAIEKLNLRAVLLAGVDFKDRTNLRSTGNILVAEYAPYSELFPQAAAVVHSGGIGTTAQALSAGKPMIVMPFSHDQPDNAARIVRLGAGTTISRSRYTVKRVAGEIEKLLMDRVVAARACAIAKEIQRENGIEAAADGLEGIYADVARATGKEKEGARIRRPPY
jgi:rhamnosyltransferase subunit B